MNQGNLEVVKQEMKTVNTDILGIGELKWTKMGEFNSDNYYMYYCEQEILRRNRVALIVNERVQNVVLGCNLKRQNDLYSFPRQTIQYHKVIFHCVYVPQFLHSFIWQWTFRLLPLAIVNSAAMNIGVHVSFRMWFSQDICPVVRLMSLMVILFLVF